MTSIVFTCSLWIICIITSDFTPKTGISQAQESSEGIQDVGLSQPFDGFRTQLRPFGYSREGGCRFSHSQLLFASIATTALAACPRFVPQAQIFSGRNILGEILVPSAQVQMSAWQGFLFTRARLCLFDTVGDG
jgi:hypothetical protein